MISWALVLSAQIGRSGSQLWLRPWFISSRFGITFTTSVGRDHAGVEAARGAALPGSSARSAGAGVTAVAVSVPLDLLQW